ncbi:class I SAM-dependent methyltransferase, partial [Streptomyces sp. URMC 127]|uniref:class I SAM-dependent methyltransferase n=1 Tax=Streptomyces sp. URMC 127 TaxID=3423402 RepID=UPI003F1A2E0D
MLEIGVGSGLLLSRIVPEVESYWGVDLSAAVIERLGRQVRDAGWSGRVELRVGGADEVVGLPVGFFDTVVLNSVVQYFPDRGYLERVLDRVVGLLAPGGRVVVGDVRYAGSLRVLHEAVVRAQGGRGVGAGALRAAVDRAVLVEKELVVAPEFFCRWAEGRGDVVADVRLKPGGYHNELTRHRYEVVLHRSPGAVLPVGDGDVPRVVWGGDVAGLEGLEGVLGGGPVRVSGIPNLRLATEAGRDGGV